MGVGGNCGPEGDASNNINTRNITFRRVRGTVQSPGVISCRKGNPCSINFDDVQLKTTRPWSCANVKVGGGGSSSPPVPACPIGPNVSAPAPPGPPRPAPPTPRPAHACAVTKRLGCFDDTKAGSVLPTPQPRLHDIVTLENCASACFGAKLAIAGIDGGNHCWCGSSLTGATAQKRPDAECAKSACHGNRSETGCGAAGRLMAYAFSCK